MYNQLILGNGEIFLKNKFRTGLYFLLSLSAMLMIFVFSSQTAEESKALSDGLAAKLILFFSDIFPLGAEFLKNGENIRTVAHAFEYMCLGICYQLFFLELWADRGYSIKFCAFVSALCALAYAFSDEVHQIFVPGRAFQISDIAVDFLGCVVGIAATAFLVKHINHTGASSNEQF